MSYIYLSSQMNIIMLNLHTTKKFAKPCCIFEGR